MGDLRTFFNDPIMPMETSLEGDLTSARGGDPNFPEGRQETPNSVSGLPLLPHRQVSTEAPPDLPSLEDRNPGNVDTK